MDARQEKNSVLIMAYARPKVIGTSKYKGVSLVKKADRSETYRAQYKRIMYYNESEYECAKMYDIMLLKDGKKAVNVLTKKV